jgi:uncharacterized protein (DUF1501 family)
MKHSIRHSRRSFFRTAAHGLLGAALGAGIATALPGVLGRAFAATQSKRRFVFVINQGGWDPLNALTPMFDAANIAMPVQTTATTIAGMKLVDSAQRPSVRSFFEAHGSRTTIVHGIAVRSVAHEVCQLTMMTGSATGAGADFATHLASAGVDQALPHLVLAGPVYPGPLAPLVARAGATGQLQGLVDASLLKTVDASTPPLEPFRNPTRDTIDNFVRRRTNAWVDAVPGARDDLADVQERARQLKGLRGDLSFATTGAFDQQIDLAVEVLSRGVSQCVTISPPVSWDTHTDSDNLQSQLWEFFFQNMNRLAARLSATPAPIVAGQSNGTLADDTIVVVLSEMARTPQLNAENGRDHWPWTSVMLFGNGITGGRAIGGYDDGYGGLGIDPGTCEIDASRASPTPAQLGATLMALADVDPTVLGPGIEPLTGLIE